MYRIICIIFLLFLTACGGGDTGVSGPGEISYVGLTYDVQNGFVGLPETPVANMPTMGTVQYEGVLRANITDTYHNGTANVVADFGANTFNFSGSVDFQNSGGYGIITLNESGVITGNSFTSTNGQLLNPGDTYLEGDFYDTGGNVAAGQVFSIVHDGNTLYGVFITEATVP